MKQIRKIEQKKEEKKKQPKKIKDVTVNDDNEVARLVKLVIGVVVFVLVFYAITALLTNKDKKSEDKKTEIQYTEILVGELWSQKGSYYVFASKMEDDQTEKLYEAYLELYHSKHTNDSYYIIDLRNVFNRNYVAEESNLSVGNHSEIRFKGDTLLKVVDGAITETYEGREAIINHLNSVM